jgi:hypothetical protein
LLAFGGFFVPSLVSGALSIVIARLLVPLVVGWMGGDDAVAVEMIAEGARVGGLGARGALARHAAEGTVAKGPPAQRNAMAVSLAPIIVAVFLGLIGVANAAGAGQAEDVECTAGRVTQKNGRFSAKITCAFPTGEESLERAAAVPPPAKFTAKASKGLLGVWLLDSSAFLAQR